MMKLRRIAVASLVIGFTFNMPMYAQQTKQEQKEQKEQVKQQKDVKNDLYKKSGKDAEKAAKKLIKEGWKTMGLPIAKQLEELWMKQYEKDASGYPRYIVVANQTVANTFSAGQMLAENVAKVRIAGEIGTSIASLASVDLANGQISQKDAASITNAVENTKLVVSQKLGRTVKVLELYRNLPNNNVEVWLALSYDTKTAMSVARQALLEELKGKLEMNNEQLEKMIGMDRLMDNCKIAPDEIVK